MSIMLSSALSSFSTSIFFLGGSLGFAGGFKDFDGGFAAMAFFVGAFACKLALSCVLQLQLNGVTHGLLDGRSIVLALCP